MNRRTLIGSALGLFLAPRSRFDFVENKLVRADNAYAQGMNPKLVTLYFPNGCDPEFWNLDQALSPLSDLTGAASRRYLAFRNVNNPVSSAAGRDGHMQGGATLFSGFRLVGGSNQLSGPSIDQVASSVWNPNTPYGKSLVTGVWRGFAGGRFREENWYRRSWLQDGSPVTPFQNPLDAFRSVFGDVEPAQNDPWKGSALDVLVKRYDELAAATSKLGTAEKKLISDHAERLRELEKSLASFAENTGLASCPARPSEPRSILPDQLGILRYEDFEEAYRLLMDVTVAALACGATRTASLMFCSAGENYLNPSISRSLHDHGSSHYSNAEGRDIFIRYRHFHMRNVVYFTNALAQAGLIDSTAVLVGSEFGESRQHVRSPQPHLLMGGSDFFRTDGSFVNWQGRSNNDLYRNILQGLGLNVNTVGEAPFNDRSAPPTQIRRTS